MTTRASACSSCAAVAGAIHKFSADWCEKTTTPCAINPEYGLLWWLNHQGSMSDLACAESFAARGAGGNIIFVEPQDNLVIVLRWCGNPKKVIDRILDSAV
jgi:hypothetical protein